MRQVTSFLLKALLLAIFSIESSYAVSVSPPNEGPVICARITRLSGQVQILNSTRTIIIDPLPNIAIPCGGWISVNEGWIQLKHKDGHLVQLVSGSMVQVSEVEQITLFHGDAFVTVTQGASELKIITANARARISKGTAIVIFDSHEQETELVSTESYPILENRFLDNTSIKIKPGELTKLNLRAMKTVPSTPVSISMSSLKDKLQKLNLEEKEETAIYNYVQSRQDKRYASLLKSKDDLLASGNDRSVASEVQNKSERASKYKRTAKDDLDQHLLKRWQDRVLAGESSSDLLYPGAPTVSLKTAKKERNYEQEQKKKLINELSEVRPE